MATHRRGLRPAQWPVRDLLGEQRQRMGALRDPRLYAAVSGLLACGAAATVVFTASDGAAVRDAGPGPMALPVPNAVVPVPADPAPSDPAPSDPAPSDPAPSDPAPSDPAPSRAGGGSAGDAGSGPVPRAWRLPNDDGPATVAVPMPADGTARTASVREIADRVAAELVRLQAEPSSDGTGLLVVPQQRDGHVTALVTRVRTGALAPAPPKRAGGRHRAQEASDSGDRPHARAKHDRDERKHDRDERKHDRDDRKHDRDDRKHDRDDRKHDRDDRKRDRDDDRKHDRDDDRKCDHDRERDRKHEGGRHHAKADAADRDDDAHTGRAAAKDGDRHEHARASTARPAMALVTSASKDGGHVRSRTIDSDALLAALDDLEHSAASRG